MKAVIFYAFGVVVMVTQQMFSMKLIKEPLAPPGCLTAHQTHKKKKMKLSSQTGKVCPQVFSHHSMTVIIYKVKNYVNVFRWKSEQFVNLGTQYQVLA